jgi:hypothetical protein
LVRGLPSFELQLVGFVFREQFFFLAQFSSFPLIFSQVLVLALDHCCGSDFPFISHTRSCLLPVSLEFSTQDFMFWLRISRNHV